MIRRYSGFLYFLPMLLMILFFAVYPLAETFRLSMFKVRLSGEEVFVGLENYRRMFEDPLFGQVMRQTLVWVVANVGMVLFLSIGLGLLLYPDFRGKQWIMTILLIPWALPYVISAVGWRWMYDPLYGHLNSLLLGLNLIEKPIGWLVDRRLVLPAVAACRVWTALPFCTLTVLSGLYSIPEELYRAARMDGASTWQVFRRITLPLLYPVLTILVVVQSIWTFNSFDMIFIMTGGGPIYSSEILVTNIYRQGFKFFQEGYASAMAVFDFVILTAGTGLYMYLNRRLGLGGIGR